MTTPEPDRLPHQRTKGPASTPAQRLVELQRELIRVSQLLADEKSRADKLQQDLDRYHRIGGVSFGGVAIAQIWADLILWEAILNENRHLRAIVELGSWQGGFSWWLWAQSHIRRINFHTFDSIKQGDVIPNFHRRDVFADRESLGEWFRALEPIILLCDNGNKPRELQEYSQELTDPGSLFVVHDWGTEFMPEDVPDTVEEVYGTFCDELGSISRVFRLKRDKDA